jgi:rubrerythrin
MRRRYAVSRRFFWLIQEVATVLEDLTIAKAVDFAIKTEETGAKVYSKLANRFADNQELKELFELLAKEEVAHQRTFEKLRERLPEEPVSGGPEQMQYLRAMSISEFFAGEGLFSKEQVETREDALHRAFNLEKATLQFYQAMRDVIGENEVLEAVIQAEKSHVVSIMRYLITDAKVRGVP